MKIDNKELTWSHCMLHHVLLQQVVNNDPKTVWFKEGEQAFPFGLDEFCLLSRLKGTTNEEINVPHSDELI